MKPTTKQLRYLRDLANSRGQTFRYPQTRAEASAEIRRLRARRPDSRLARAVERREGERAVPREQFDAAAVTPAGDQRLRQPRALGGPGQRAMSAAGERVELARYQVDTGERVLYGQRINGKVAVADVPAGDRGRVYLVERHVESKAALDELVAHYVADCRRRGEPAARCPAVEMLAEGLE